MKSHSLADLRKLPVILFMNVPIGAEILFNGCRCIKLDEKHVKFLTDIDGNPTDYSKSYNKRYARTTQAAIEGTPCRILKLPFVGDVRALIKAADALISQAKRAAIAMPLVVEDLHTANLALSDADARLDRHLSPLSKHSMRNHIRSR